MAKFNKKDWIEKPETYPMVMNFTTNPLVPIRPVLRDDFTSVRPIEDGSYLLKRDNGKWFAVPEDVYHLIRSDCNG